MTKPYEQASKKSRKHRPSRTEVRKVPCPNCGAPPNEKCVGARDKIRESNHMERVYSYLGVKA